MRATLLLLVSALNLLTDTVDTEGALGEEENEATRSNAVEASSSDTSPSLLLSTTFMRLLHGEDESSLFSSFMRSDSSVDAVLLDLSSTDPLSHISIPEKYFETDPASRANPRAHS